VKGVGRGIVPSLAALLLWAACPAAAEPLLAGVTYSPTRVNFAEPDPYVSKERLRADLAQVARITDRVRTYTVEHGMDQVAAVAREFKMKVSLGLWLGRDKALNEAALATGIATARAYPDTVDRIFVGNETLLRHDLSAAELRTFLQRVRKGIANPRIEITTAETWNLWLQNAEVAEECDVIGLHLLPYWDGYAVGEGAAAVAERYDQVRQAFPAKRIVIAETGWPSRGAPWKGSQPSIEAEVAFLRDFVALAAQRRFDYYVLEAFDQPWKIAWEGEVGGYWGLFDAEGRPKFDFATLRKAR
jgi:exo-beta-1,3-glucanase (GH17 family)